MSIKKEIKDKIKLSLKKLNIDEDNIIIEVPKDKTKGDYSTSIAMTLTKKLKQKPMDIAKKILENIELEDLATAEAVLPGFINFKLNKEYLLSKINTIITEGKNYGRNNAGNNTKINIEFVSANPTGSLHIGHARGATYGDNLARILKFSGYDVTKEYYVNNSLHEVKTFVFIK